PRSASRRLCRPPLLTVSRLPGRARAGPAAPRSPPARAEGGAGRTPRAGDTARRRGTATRRPPAALPALRVVGGRCRRGVLPHRRVPVLLQPVAGIADRPARLRPE